MIPPLPLRLVSRSLPAGIIPILSATLTNSGFAAEKITYDDDIFPIFEAKCLNCHNPDKKKGDLNLATYTGSMAGSSGGKVALAGDGGSSKLFTVAAHLEEPVMPPEGEKIAKKDADLIRAWIDGGLLENQGSKAKKRKKPAFDLEAVPTGEKPEGPPPMPRDLLLEPVVTPERATVVADMESSPWAPLLAVTAPRQVLLYHSDSLELLGILPFPKGNPETLSFHPSGKYLLAGGGIGGKSGTTVTWDVTTGEVMMTMGREFDSVLAADLRADLGGVALGGPSRLIKLWDPDLGEQIKSIKKHTDWVTAVAYSPDGVLLATGDRNNGLQIWEARTGNEFHSLRGHQKSITDLKWRADSNLIASASEDGTIRFWDMNRGREIKKGNAGPGVLALDYARSGRLISVGRDKRVKLWKPDLSIEKQSNPAAHLLTEVAFSHDAARYFTADWNGHIEVWDSADLKKIGELSATPSSIATRLASLREQESQLVTEVDEARQKLSAARKTVEMTEQARAEAEAGLAALQSQTIPMLKEQIGKIEAAIRQLNGDARNALEEAKKAHLKREELSKQASQNNGGDPDLKQQIAHQKHLADEMEAQHQQKTKERQTVETSKAEKVAELQTQNEHAKRLQQKVEELGKALPPAQEAVATAEAELQQVTEALDQHRLRVKKWRAAQINTELIAVRKELAGLILAQEEDPSLAGKIAELTQRRDSLADQYQAAK